jgi:hypothetical protein
MDQLFLPAPLLCPYVSAAARLRPAQAGKLPTTPNRMPRRDSAVAVDSFFGVLARVVAERWHNAPAGFFALPDVTL